MEFTEEQKFILEQYKEGKNIFITGPGGVGKSELVKTLCEMKKSVVTATTGCAAIRLHCDARTIHSWSGIGLGTKSIEEIIRKMHPLVKGEWKTTKVLIIDEVSMLSKRIFDMLNEIGKRLRRNGLPFGGIQVIFLGDFFQLPPVGDSPDTQAFCFESPDWDDVFDIQIELTKIFRQKDEAYAKILTQIRRGVIKKSADKILRSRVGLIYKGTIMPTKLYPTRMRVDEMNRRSMGILDGESVVFTMKAIMRIHGREMEIEYENIKKGLLVEPELTLKVGAQVMCVVNIKNDKTMELCNGSQGIVTGFADGLPVVQFQNGVHRPIGPHIWESERIPNVGISQIPLILAWAISIHKSQGSTLDLAEIDIGSGIFECGQSYVALSRVKSLEGLYLSSYDPGKIQINKKVKEFYEKFL